jgi:hypothetical protein
MAKSVRQATIELLEQRVRECQKEYQDELQRCNGRSDILHLLKHNLELNKKLLAATRKENCVGVDFINYGID